MKRKLYVQELTEYQKKLRIYYAKCIFSELSKTCIFLLVFMLLKLLPEYIIALITLFALRGTGGGLHFKHYTTCLVVSFTFLYMSIFLSQSIILPTPIIYVSIMISALLGYILVPITSKNHLPATTEQIRRSKRNTTIIIFIIFILIYICHNTKYILICYWTVILHILQLIAAYTKEVRRNV